MPSRDATKCPRCGAKTKVIETRITGGDMTRRRECPVCFTRYRTKEIDVDGPGVFADKESFTHICIEMFRQEYTTYDLLKCLLLAMMEVPGRKEMEDEHRKSKSDI